MRVPLNVSVLPDSKVAIEALAAMLQRLPGAVEHIGLVVEHEHGGSAAGHDAQRLVGGVEHECPRHRWNAIGIVTMRPSGLI